MKKRILYSLIILFCLPSVSGMAQIRVKETIHDAKSLVMLTPQYIFVKQLRLEYDRKIIGRHWVTLAPHYVQDIEPYEKHQGFGLVATYKYVLRNSSTYFGGGAQITNHTINSSAFDDASHADLWLLESKVKQYGFNIIAGRYIRLYPSLFGDIYGGFGYRISKTTSSDGTINDFGSGFLDFGYSGFMIVIGARLGIML